MGQAHADPAIVAAKHTRIREPHVAPLSDLADKIATTERLPAGVVPYPHPDFGSIHARALFLLDNPGPRATLGTGGSGLLSIDHNDPSATRAHAAYQRFRFDQGLCLHWNVCPFPTALDQSSTAERTRAIRSTTELLRLLPRLELVVLLGRAAEDGWRRATVRRDDLTILTAPHPSNRGINAVPGNQEHFLATMKRVADDLAYPPRHPQ